MPEPLCTIHVDGQPLEGRAGASLAVTLLQAGCTRFRSSCTGQDRAPLCGMGTCYECQVRVDGRWCGPAWSRCGTAWRCAPVSEVARVDLAVVGAGPAGMAAAAAAAGQGRRVWVLDEGFRPGGQIWRHRPGEAPPGARRLLAALAAGGVQVLGGASVFDAWRQDRAWRLAVSTARGRLDLEAPALVLACGARERFAPFPGWTLPGVLGAGGGQALLKEGLDLAGRPGAGGGQRPPAAAGGRGGAPPRRAAPGHPGTGPLARVLGLAPLLATRPAKALQALGLGWATLGSPYRPGWWVAEAVGDGRLEQVRITDGRGARLLPCRWLFCGFGLVPNLELGRHLGCALAGEALEVDGAQGTSQEGIYAAGEVCGIAGLEAALAEGRIAGLAAAGAWDPDSREGRPWPGTAAGPGPWAAAWRTCSPPGRAPGPAPPGHAGVPLRGRALLGHRSGLGCPGDQAVHPGRHGPLPGAGVRPHPGPAFRARAGHGAPAGEVRAGGGPGGPGRGLARKGALERGTIQATF